MTDQPESAYRQHYRAAGGDLNFREDTDDGMFSVTMPIASTGEVRNEGDDPLSSAELQGMARQVNDREIPVFIGHGMDTTVADGHYSALGKLGTWTDAEYQTREGSSDVLMATARMPDPEELSPVTGPYRQALAVLKEQAKRGIAQDASIGWREDDNFPGGNDLMEASIVGIGADWRTNTGDESAEVVARAAVAAGADPDELVSTVRDAVAPDDSRAEYEVGDETIEISPPDYMVNAADLAMQKSGEGLGSDCGTGVGDTRADQIREDEVGPEVIDEVAAYLTSHEEDVTADGTPDEWSDEEWDDCGNMQYAKWGGLGTGTALEWAQARANAVADAKGEELPYPDRSTQTDMTDDDTPDEPDGGTTQNEQDADDGETRMPEDVTENQLLTFTAMHYEGMDEEDLMEATDAADAEYVGEADMEALIDLASTATGAEYGDVEAAMADLMSAENEYGEDGEKEDDEEEDMDDEEGRDLSERVAELEDQLSEFRSGDGAVQTPGDDSDEESEERDADADEDSDDETTTERATAGPNWRSD